MYNPNKLKILLLQLLVFFGLIAISCNLPRLSSQEQPNLTLTAMSGAIAGTATADAQKGDQALIDLQTAEARATATTRAIQSTQAVRATSEDTSKYATATASAPILAELAFYDVDTSLGHVGWITTTQTLTVTGYQQTKVAMAPVTAADFVLASDVTWDSRYASGCGFMFRLNGDPNKPDAYMFIISRVATGHAVFTALVNGELANIHDFYPKDNDKSFNADNDATNRIAVVARGNILEFYSNQAKIAEVDTTQPPSPVHMPAPPVKPPSSEGQEAMDRYQEQAAQYQDYVKQMQTQYGNALNNYSKNQAIFTDGLLGLSVLSEAGSSQCRFDNTWLWIIDQ
jgi:hypothetical protein